MALDKKLYRQAFEYYRQWNEAELIDRVRNAGKLSPQELWQRYLALIDFGLGISRQSSEWQRKEKLAHLAQYYENLLKLEDWRRAHARSS